MSYFLEGVLVGFVIIGLLYIGKFAQQSAAETQTEVCVGRWSQSHFKAKWDPRVARCLVEVPGSGWVPESAVKVGG